MSTPPVPYIEIRKIRFPTFQRWIGSERAVPARLLQCWLGGLAFGRLAYAIGRRLLRSPVCKAWPRASLSRNHRRPPAFGALENMPWQVGFIHLCLPKNHVCSPQKGRLAGAL